MSEYFQSIFSNTFVFVKEVVVFLFTVGWYLLVTVIILVVVRFLWRLYLKTIQEDFVKDQDWSFLSIRVPKVNQSSLQAMEQVFAQIHAIISSSTFAKKYFEGVVPLWYSLEIVSLGGKISQKCMK
jgi:multidrug efflux pump subunit AcrB